jgi:DNA-binding transcriptional ArsR family regulator
MPGTLPSRVSTVSRKAVVPAVPVLEGRSGVDLQASAQEAAALLKALANPDRLLLLCQIVDADHSVAELGELTGIAQPSLSQQLAVLRGERLVSTRREGKHVVYRVDSPAALAVLQTLHGLFCKPDAPASVRRSGPTRKRTRRVAA